MFYKTISASVFFAATVYAPAVFADCANLICDSVYIERLVAESGALTTNQDFYVQTTGTESALTCSPDSAVNLKLNGDDPHAKEVYAMLLTAFSLDKPVSIRIVSGSAPCEIAYVTLAR
jgi:hypothetical protein